ncbi:two-component regulator propeller domain-containing protein [uncultured Draconibacterium sp.]|uniref:hybrid sensor histidine kinase/response regulator transcription factor n=1 Tax=uncultured Draconibacterium sp. TaxID=1573823 RepID=UPI0029C8D67E|nr:two-component regulator propeller domain-containing protein [uncultured Draconibacterium sp.]
MDALADIQVDYRFRRMSPESGFFHNGIQAISQDEDGYIWFISINELYKFDGYKFDRIQKISLLEGEVRDPQFLDIFNDSQSHMWVATNKGLFIYDIESTTFQPTFNSKENVLEIAEDQTGNIWFLMSSKIGMYDPDKKGIVFMNTGLSEDEAFSVIFSDEANLWLGTQNGKIFRFDERGKSFKLFTQLSTRANILAIETTLNDIFFLAEGEGIYHYSKDGNFVDRYTFFLEDLDIKGNNLAKALYIDKRGILWIGTHRGLYVFDLSDKKYRHYTSSVTDNFSLPNNSIWTITEDSNEGVWIGTYSGGLGYVNYNDHLFKHVRETEDISLNNNTISAFAEDEYGNLWLGTEGSGLAYYERTSNKFTHFSHSYSKNSLSYDNVKSLVIDTNNNLWVASYKGGLDFFDSREKQFTNYQNIPNDINSLTSNTIYSLQLEQDSGLWIATENGAIDFFHFRSHQFEHILDDSPNSDMSNHFNNGIFRGANNKLWMATRHGLGMLDIKSRIHHNYYFNLKDTLTFGSNEIFCVYEDQKEIIWLGTRGYGIFSFDPRTQEFRNYSSNEGLTASAVYSILDDDEGNLWLSTNNGLFKFELENKKFHRFDSSDGLQGNLFYPNSALKCKSGELVFGGTNGFTVFKPDLIKKNPTAPEVILTGFSINNKQVSKFTNEEGELKQIGYIEKIKLNHTQRVFSFEFSANNYLMPEKNQFAYRLMGYDDEWKYTNADQRFATYSNLYPGTYKFIVKASNNDGIWSNQTKTVMLEILPPPWKTWWAVLLYSLFVIGVIFILLRVYLIRKEYREQLHLERLSKEKIAELNRIKIQFFTNISHEFKTPLTLIASPLRKMLNSMTLDGQLEKEMNLVYRNVVRLQNLINQLMDFRAMENKKMVVKNENGDVAVFIKELLLLFEPLVKEHRIEMTFECSQHKIPACFDQDRLEKIFYNLLSNAVKYTPTYGHIIVYLDLDQKQKSHGTLEEFTNLLKVRITNTGVPIPANELEHIFDNYYHIDRNDSFIQAGSGVGLAFTKELVELLNGQIEASSNLKETSFKLSIPLKPYHAEREEINKMISESAGYEFNYSQKLVDILVAEKKNDEKVFKLKSRSLNTLLIVEDSSDLREHLYELFKNDYNVLVAPDGVKGLKLAQDKNPTIIVSDVFMPNMSGIEMSRELKTNLVTSHIPIVMLSAYNSPEQKKDGLETGADVYVEKPFDPDYLMLQVKNLIQSREAIRMAFSKKIIAEPSKVKVSSTDDEFIQRSIKLVEDHMDNSQFNVDSFVKEIGIGRTILYKKIKALTDLSVNEFIQNIRLKRAAQLLKDSDLSISEVAYHVGFNEPKYFSTCFKKQFNQTPTSYIETYRIK